MKHWAEYIDVDMPDRGPVTERGVKPDGIISE
jgi:hypothetical protein